MSVRAVNLESLGLLDGGKLAEALNINLSRAAADCEDRPADPSARKVVLTITLSPSIAPDGNMEDVKGQFFVESKVPSHRTKPYSFGLRRIPGRGATLVFNEDSPERFTQGTLLGDDDRAE